MPGKPLRGREDYVFSPGGAQVVFSVRAAGAGEPWSTNFDLYAVAADGGAPRNQAATAGRGTAIAAAPRVSGVNGAPSGRVARAELQNSVQHLIVAQTGGERGLRKILGRR